MPRESGVKQPAGVIQPGTATGPAVLRDPLHNKGSAFSERERDALGVRGLLPPRAESLDEQVARVMENVGRRAPSMTLDGRTHVPGQGKNCYIFPGVARYLNHPFTVSAALPAPFLMDSAAAPAARVTPPTIAPITCFVTSPAVAPLLFLPTSRR